MGLPDLRLDDSRRNLQRRGHLHPQVDRPLRTGPGSIVVRCRHRTRLGPGAGRCDREPAV